MNERNFFAELKRSNVYRVAASEKAVVSIAKSRSGILAAFALLRDETSRLLAVGFSRDGGFADGLLERLFHGPPWQHRAFDSLRKLSDTAQ